MRALALVALVLGGCKAAAPEPGPVLHHLGTPFRRWVEDPNAPVPEGGWARIYGATASDSDVAFTFTSWGCHEVEPDRVGVVIAGQLRLIVPFKGGMASMSWSRCKAFATLARGLPP